MDRIFLFDEENLPYFNYKGLSQDFSDVTKSLSMKKCYQLSHRIMRILQRKYTFSACLILCPFSIKYVEKFSGHKGLCGGAVFGDTIYMTTILNSYNDFIHILAHEYMHIIQNNNNVEINCDKLWGERDHEIEADKFADDFIKSFKL